MQRLNLALVWLAGWLAVAAPAATAWADVAPTPLIKRLPGPTRAKVLAALAGLIILGFGMVALIWLAARVTQRYRHRTPYFRPTPRPGEHDWAKKPLDK
jgi:Na+/melibiose symporter-like transporter